jgi:hypothetical protein
MYTDEVDANGRRKTGCGGATVGNEEKKGRGFEPQTQPLPGAKMPLAAVIDRRAETGGHRRLRGIQQLR